MMDLTQSANQSVDPQDKLSQIKTIYEAGPGEIFFKNFLAGFGRALGGVFIYIVFLVIAFYFFNSYVYPQIKPFFDQYQQAMQSLNKINNLPTTGPGTGPDSAQYRQLLEDLQQNIQR